jgi:hypothetical protein
MTGSGGRFTGCRICQWSDLLPLIIRGGNSEVQDQKKDEYCQGYQPYEVAARSLTGKTICGIIILIVVFI